MTDLRDKVARLARQESSGRRLLPPWDGLDKGDQQLWLQAADAILALPEIAEALEIKREIESPPPPPLTNEQLRALVDRMMLGQPLPAPPTA